MKVDTLSEIIRIRLVGAIAPQKRLRVLEEISHQLDLTGLSNVIIDVTRCPISSNEPMINALEIIDFMKKLGFHSGVKLAFIYSDGECHRSYFETLSNMNGFKVKYFRELNDAEKWLEEAG